MDVVTGFRLALLLTITVVSYIVESIVNMRCVPGQPIWSACMLLDLGLQ